MSCLCHLSKLALINVRFLGSPPKREIRDPESGRNLSKIYSSPKGMSGHLGYTWGVWLAQVQMLDSFGLTVVTHDVLAVERFLSYAHSVFCVASHPFVEIPTSIVETQIWDNPLQYRIWNFTHHPHSWKGICISTGSPQAVPVHSKFWEALSGIVCLVCIYHYQILPVSSNSPGTWSQI